MRKTEFNVKYHLICNDIGWKQKTKKCHRGNIRSNIITNTGRKKNDLTMFKCNAALKTNSNLLSDVMRTDTRYLINAIMLDECEKLKTSAHTLSAFLD